ncbi:MAG: tryptophan synthase subunit alpha [Phycisphaeraceae bacterium]|nr:tryptophan synthase subunit alpha [Phycisphaeraceae bacterium]
MNRIEQIFADLRDQGRKGLMPFLTAGDPNLATTAELLRAADRAGATICEVGFPFSDPIADGPVIEASMHRAIEQGVRPADIFRAVADVRSDVDLGLVAMVSYSIVYRIGPDKFVEDAAAAGFDGFIFPDLPLEEAEKMVGRVRAADMTCSLLVAPGTSRERAQAIAKASSGFVYLLARAGITGESDAVATAIDDRVAMLREVTELPIAVGFGISAPEHVEQVVESADAAIVGSALVRRVHEHADEGEEACVAAFESYVKQLAGGLG